MRPLNGAPRVVLSDSKFCLLGWMPTNRRWIKQQLSALQRRKPRSFWIPLVPAHQRANTSNGGVKSLVTKITRSEVILFVVERIVRNVHLAVKPAQRSI